MTLSLHILQVASLLFQVKQIQKTVRHLSNSSFLVIFFLTSLTAVIVSEGIPLIQYRPDPGSRLLLHGDVVFKRFADYQNVQLSDFFF